MNGDNRTMRKVEHRAGGIYSNDQCAPETTVSCMSCFASEMLVYCVDERGCARVDIHCLAPFFLSFHPLLFSFLVSVSFGLPIPPSGLETRTGEGELGDGLPDTFPSRVYEIGLLNFSLFAAERSSPTQPPRQTDGGHVEAQISCLVGGSSFRRPS